MEEMANNPNFNSLTDDMLNNEEKWVHMLNSSQAEQEMPEPWMNGSDITATSEAARAIKKLILIRILRPDRLFAASN